MNNQELVEILMKGGPGSGPHPGGGGEHPKATEAKATASKNGFKLGVHPSGLIVGSRVKNGHRDSVSIHPKTGEGTVHYGFTNRSARFSGAEHLHELTKVAKGGPGSGPHPGGAKSEAAFKQSAVASRASAVANAKANPDKLLERKAADAHDKAEKMHSAAAKAHAAGNPKLAGQHTAAAKDHSNKSAGHIDVAYYGGHRD